jgi:hypothetical protein
MKKYYSTAFFLLALLNSTPSLLATSQHFDANTVEEISPSSGSTTTSRSHLKSKRPNLSEQEGQLLKKQKNEQISRHVQFSFFSFKLQPCESDESVNNDKELSEDIAQAYTYEEKYPFIVKYPGEEWGKILSIKASAYDEDSFIVGFSKANKNTLFIWTKESGQVDLNSDYQKKFSPTDSNQAASFIIGHSIIEVMDQEKFSATFWTPRTGFKDFQETLKDLGFIDDTFVISSVDNLDREDAANSLSDSSGKVYGSGYRGGKLANWEASYKIKF